MAQITETLAEKLDPVQAMELARIIELQAKWENTREPAATFSTLDLQERQRAYDAFRARQSAYTARYRTAQVSEVSLNGPERVGTWAKTVRAVLRRAELEAKTDAPIHTVAKASRLVNRIADRLKLDPLPPAAPTDGIAAAIRNLDAVIQWCDDAVGPPAVIATIGPVDGEPAVVRERVA